MLNNQLRETLENQPTNCEIYVVTDAEVFENLSQRPQCQEMRIFHDFLFGLNLNKVNKTSNKPFFLGFALLELIKLQMVKFEQHIQAYSSLQLLSPFIRSRDYHGCAECPISPLLVAV